MEELEHKISAWGESLWSFHLPRWEELPELDLYMDQVITLVDHYLSPVIHSDKHTLLTASMVNNYVKNGMIPPPKKKRYTRKHVAFLIAITLLKQVLTINEVKQGILFQGKMIGIRQAYNLYCEIQEAAIQQVCAQATGHKKRNDQSENDEIQFLAAYSASKAFANKLLAEKVIALQTSYLKEGIENE
ncbi:MAG TPA: DUF1836 domain-containing protein [Enterococcus aquimarinus]|nr:DUF1836 domain-containing protein [Enterococcus aquimarinus]